MRHTHRSQMIQCTIRTFGLGCHLIVIIKIYEISVVINSGKELGYESSIEETTISLLFYSKPCVVRGLRR